MLYVNKSILRVKNYIFVQIVFSMIATISIALIPAYNRYLVDVILIDKGRTLERLIIAYVVSYLIFLMTTWCSERLVWKTAINFESTLKKECFNRLLKLSYRKFSERKKEEYLSLITNHVTRIEQDYLQPICALVKSIIAIIIYAVIVSANTKPIICAFLFGLSAISTFTPRLYKKRLNDAGKAYVDEAANYMKKIADLFSGFELVDSISEKAFSTKNEKITDHLSKKRHLLGKEKVNGNTISGFAISLIDIVIFGLCGYMFLMGEITAGTVLAAITYSQSFTDPLQELLYDINTLNSSKDIVDSLEEIFIIDKKSGELYEMPSRYIKLEDFRISYPGKTLSFNFTFQVGRKYVVKGSSGRGKTTLLNAILGRCSTQGNIFVDNVERYLTEEECYYCSQQQHIFNDSTFNNITLFGSYPYLNILNEEETILREMIKDISDCSALSGGEKQILKLYRLLVQRKPILLLDEPFSALDNANTRKAFHILSDLSATIILVSHNVEFDGSDLDKWEIINIEEICYEM